MVRDKPHSSVPHANHFVIVFPVKGKTPLDKSDVSGIAKYLPMETGDLLPPLQRS